jgi:hypothetical protein
MGSKVPYDHTIALLCIYPHKTLENAHSSAIHNNPKVEVTKCPITNALIDKICYLHKIGYHWAIKRNKEDWGCDSSDRTLA